MVAHKSETAKGDRGIDFTQSAMIFQGSRALSLFRLDLVSIKHCCVSRECKSRVFRLSNHVTVMSKARKLRGGGVNS